jgi:predicted PolB exonuclease-like 3'-5' exonuclease
MNVFVFDIETVPDVAGGKRLFGLDGLSDGDVVKALEHLRKQETGGETFLRHFLHRVVAISVAWRYGERFKVWSLGDPEAPERELISRFFDGIERYGPTLVSWNGSGFDLPVLHYRALVHGVAAPRYWEVGDDDREFRYNNYLGRFHWRHIDLMDVIAGYSMRAVAPLDQVATLLGLPGKMGMDGSKVWESYQQGDIEGIRNYCETDVLNTYLVYLRFELIRGRLSAADYDGECERVRESLLAEERPHFNEFLDAWLANGAH